jgi:hypothetical protein
VTDVNSVSGLPISTGLEIWWDSTLRWLTCSPANPVWRSSHHYLPHATLAEFKTIKEFFERGGEEVDAFVFAAEAGSAWTLLYPAYTVVVPQPGVIAIPLAYPMAHGDPDLARGRLERKRQIALS